MFGQAEYLKPTLVLPNFSEPDFSPPNNHDDFTPHNNNNFTPHDNNDFTPHDDNNFTPHDNNDFTLHDNGDFTPRDDHDNNFTLHDDHKNNFTPHDNDDFTPHDNDNFTPHNFTPYDDFTLPSDGNSNSDLPLSDSKSDKEDEPVAPYLPSETDRCPSPTPVGPSSMTFANKRKKKKITMYKETVRVEGKETAV